jgi:8-oxo-dGTP diphosphatase
MERPGGRIPSRRTGRESAPVTDGVAPAVAVVAAVIVRDGRVLLCHRCPDRQWYPNVWDFPGGHVEAGESATTALVRELREELGIAITEPSSPEFCRLVTSRFDMRIWVVEEWAGALVNAAPTEHDAVEWMSADAVAGLALADDTYPSLIARALLVVHNGPS